MRQSGRSFGLSSGATGQLTLDELSFAKQTRRLAAKQVGRSERDAQESSKLGWLLIRYNSMTSLSMTNNKNTMKLNSKMPKARQQRADQILLRFTATATLALLLICGARHQAESRPQQTQEPVSLNEISQQVSTTNYSNLSRDVTNLRMMPDLRAIRLRWSYVQPNSSHARPAAFAIRYCELTSWMAEIKCRHRNVPVAPSVGVDVATNETNDDGQAATTISDKANSATVIHQGDDDQNHQHNDLRQHQSDAVVWPLLASEADLGSTKLAIGMISSAFEASIYDLRALTNYTFDVHVSRFAGELPTQVAPAKLSAGHATSTRAQPRPGRRLADLPTGNELDNKLLFRAETKPFQAEALKCLANSSEVLINTGRYFGGRISVESQPNDPRCQLVGNKTSTQTSYLLHIDHELCGSRVVDSNRIETMVLVHENKDILTHNTARFLVQCNIMQKSFTVRASVSLPKVDSLNQQTRTGSSPSSNSFRPATITLLPSKPTSTIEGSLPPATFPSEQQVRLGSMPGIWRLIRTGEDQPGNDLTRSESSESASIQRPYAPTEVNTSVVSTARRSKELPETFGLRQPLLHRDLTLTSEVDANGDSYRLEAPRPVEVSSKVLFVTRAGHAEQRTARQRSARVEQLPPLRLLIPSSFENASRTLSEQQQQQLQILDGALPTLRTVLINNPPAANHSNKPPHQTTDDKQPASRRPVIDANGLPANESAGTFDDGKSTAGPIIVTNNHRVANNFFPLAQLATNHVTPNQAPPNGGQGAPNGAKVAPSSASEGFSIRYSAEQVDDYSVGQTNDVATTASNATGSPAGVPFQASPRSRSGRMRQIVQSTTSPPPSSTSSSSSTQSLSPDEVSGRMGEAFLSHDLIGAESAPPAQRITEQQSDASTELRSFTNPMIGHHARDQMPNATAVAPTLAQNLTGALIRWSLKTLGNLARKSLESLVDEREELSLALDNNRTDGHEISGRNKLRDGFLVDAPSKALAQPALVSTTTSAVGLQQQSAKAATQSADLLQSRKPHHLEPPPLLGQQSSTYQQATTAALVTASPRVSPHVATSRSVSSSSSTTTTDSPRQHIQRQQKSNGSVSQSVLPVELHPSSPIMTRSQHTRNENRKPNYATASAEKSRQADEAEASPPSSSLVFVLYALLGLTILTMLVVYFVAASFSSTAQEFNPALARQVASQPRLCKIPPSPRMGFLSQLNEAIHRNRHTPGVFQSAVAPGLCNMQTQNQHMQEQEPYMVGGGSNTKVLHHVTPSSDVRSPSMQRRAPNVGLIGSSQHLLRSPGGASDFGGSNTTRSTSAASTSNLSTRTGGSDVTEQHENYCKNHEQFVYSDYLLLNKSDCLSNECGRESFA